MEIKNTTLRLRIRGIGYRERTLSLTDRLGIINKRLNNRGLLNGTRTGENVSENIFDRNHVSNITIVKLKKGKVIVPDSKSWNSTELGRDYLDLEIAGLAPTNKDLIQATLIELILERDIISNRFEIGAKFQTRKQIGASLSVSREMIGQREARILRYFRNLNRERDINLGKSGDK